MIALVGDIHGSARALTRVREQHRDVTAIIQLGDFHLPSRKVPALGVPLYWIDGNHEHWAWVKAHQNADAPVEFAENCWYVPRGYVLDLEATRFLCLGGADSVDKAYNRSWSWAECLTGPQVVRALTASRVDVMLTHTPPQSTIVRHFPSTELGQFGLSPNWISPAACAVEVIWQHHQRPPLYCGHMHRAVDDREVTILDSDSIVPVSSPQLVKEVAL